VSLEEFIQAIEKLIDDTWVKMKDNNEPSTPTLGNDFIQKSCSKNPDK